MKQYLRVFTQLIKNSISMLTAYRADLLMRVLIGFGWSAASIITIEIIFLHTQELSGWGKSDMILLLFTFALTVDLLSNLGKGIEDLEDLIRLGTFDTIITKPIDSQFYTVFRQPNIAGLLYFVAHQLPFVIILILYPTNISWHFLPVYILFIILSNILWLSLKTIFITMNFWWQNVGNIHFLLFSIAEIGKYPMTIFPYLMQFVFYTILPIGFLAVVPSSTLLGIFSWTSLVGMISITFLFFFLSRILWQKAVREYSSASG